jgi:hypothetical protein
MKTVIFIALTIMSQVAKSQSNNTGIFERNADIGNPKIKGSVLYDQKDQSYQISGGGYNIWFNRDEFHYAFNKIKGDFILTANVKLLGIGKDPHRKIGWMVRASEQEDAAQMSAVVHGDGLTGMQWRRMRGAYMRDPEDEIYPKKRNNWSVQEKHSSCVLPIPANHYKR